MNWRLLPFETVPPPAAMAIDEALLYSAERPVLRFYRWEQPGAVTIGDQQDASEVHPRVPLVRRLSPGRALYHGPEDLTYAVIGLRSLFTALPSRTGLAEHLKAYYTICSWITRFLQASGAPAVYNRSASILVNGRKISGNAQAHLPGQGTFYQHGSIFCFSDAAERAELLSRLHGQQVPPARLASVREFTADPPAALESALIAAFTAGVEELGHSWERSALTPAERTRAQELIETKYNTDAWNRGGHVQRGPCETAWGQYPDRPEPA